MLCSTLLSNSRIDILDLKSGKNLNGFSIEREDLPVYTNMQTIRLHFPAPGAGKNWFYVVWFGNYRLNIRKIDTQSYNCISLYHTEAPIVDSGITEGVQTSFSSMLMHGSKFRILGQTSDEEGDIEIRGYEGSLYYGDVKDECLVGQVLKYDYWHSKFDIVKHAYDTLAVLAGSGDKYEVIFWGGMSTPDGEYYWKSLEIYKINYDYYNYYPRDRSLIGNVDFAYEKM